MQPFSPLPALTRIHALQTALAAWFSVSKRPLPWRENYHPYAVWISEIMLQQTQMDRAVSFFTRWMRRFPNLRTVAEAEEDAVLHAWEGLGYYSRARNLHKAARLIVERHGGVFPSSPDDIRALPGIGPYTAAAISGIAFNLRLACVDANVERVLARLFNIGAPVKSGSGAARVRALADTLLPETPREHNQALMELGALVCRKKPLCSACPLSTYCESLRLGITHERPVPGKKRESASIIIVCGILEQAGRIFVQRRREGDVWAGLWEFPGGVVERGETPEEAVIREFMEETAFAVQVRETLGVISHSYTKYRLKLHCFRLALVGMNAGAAPPAPDVLTAATLWRWLAPEELENLAMPAPHRKLAKRTFCLPTDKTA